VSAELLARKEVFVVIVNQHER